MSAPGDGPGRVLRAELPHAYKLLNVVMRMHHRARARYQSDLAWALAAGFGPRKPAAPFRRAHVRIERHSSGTPDADGLIGGIKLLLDCLLPPARHPRGIGVVVDDSPRHLVHEVVHVPAKRGRQKTVVVVTDLGDDAAAATPQGVHAQA